MRQKTPILYNAVAFYDFDYDTIQWKELYHFILKFFEDHEQTPTRMYLQAEGVKPSSKTKTFKHYDKVIRGIEFENIESFWLGGGYPEDPGGDQNSCFIGFTISFDKWHKKACLYFRDDLIIYELNELKSLFKELVTYLKAQYSFACQIDDRQKSPFCYTSSILYNDDSDEMRGDILNWDHAYNDCKSYKTGDLRNLYPLNFIGEAHLKRDVFGQTLRQWIESGHDRGTLEPLNDTLWTWEIPVENIPALRQQLKPTDLLICFRPYE